MVVVVPYSELQALKDEREQEEKIAKGEGGGLFSSKASKQLTAMEEHQKR